MANDLRHSQRTACACLEIAPSFRSGRHLPPNSLSDILDDQRYIVSIGMAVINVRDCLLGHAVSQARTVVSAAGSGMPSHMGVD